jgi:hypothetical protein
VIRSIRFGLKTVISAVTVTIHIDKTPVKAGIAKQIVRFQSK